MVITYEGVEFFKIQYGDVVIAFNPISKNSKLKGGRFGADIVCISTNNSDMNGADAMSFGDKKPFVIAGPGEYEVKGVFVRGLQTETEYGGEKVQNTVYLVEIEGMTICFLGALSTKELPKAASEVIDAVDVLFVPIGSDGVLSPADAYQLAVSLEPKLIIPMHYGSVGSKNALEIFLKEGGIKAGETHDKLTLKKKDLEGKDGEVVIVKAQN